MSKPFVNRRNGKRWLPPDKMWLHASSEDVLQGLEETEIEKVLELLGEEK